MILLPAPLRLRLDKATLVSNWNWLNQRSGNAACGAAIKRSEEHTSELQSLMRISYAVFCLKKKKQKKTNRIKISTKRKHNSLEVNKLNNQCDFTNPTINTYDR